MKTAKILTAVFLLAAMAMASPQSKDFKNKGGDGYKKSLHKELKLTAEQTKQLEALRKSNEKDQRADREKLQRAQEKLRQELFKDKPNQTDIEIYKKDIIYLQSRQLDNMTDEILNLRKVLTKEQLETLKNRQEKGFRGNKKGAETRGAQKQNVQKGKKSR